MKAQAPTGAHLPLTGKLMIFPSFKKGIIEAKLDANAEDEEDELMYATYFRSTKCWNEDGETRRDTVLIAR